MQLLIAILLAYYVNIIVVKKNKSIELLIHVLDQYLEHLEEINNLTLKYIREKEISDAHEILWKLKKLSMSLQKIEQLYKLYPDDISTYPRNKMVEDLQNLKISITNDPFKQEKKYSSSQKIEILKNFEIIETKVLKEKKNLLG
ncbi:hypothetical protein [Halarcobacter sp.]|uniref:hypothetical protein n=1 Tax=Halarcobacter sp. TaxID=2321133 RepID=UPI003A948288